MFNAKHTSMQALIVGAFDGIGQDFARMAALKGKHLIMVDSDENSLIESRQLLMPTFPDTSFKIIAEDLSGFDSADNIFESVLFTQAFSENVESIGMLINILEFQLPFEDIADFQEEDFGKHLDFLTLSELTELFATEMLRNGQGEILNVLTGPENMHDWALDHYKSTERMLMTFSKSLNHKVSHKGVSIHALSYSGSGLVFLSPDATAAPGQAPSSYSMDYVQELLTAMS